MKLKKWKAQWQSLAVDYDTDLWWQWQATACSIAVTAGAKLKLETADELSWKKEKGNSSTHPMTLKGVEISSLPVADSLFCFGSHLGNFPTISPVMQVQVGPNIHLPFNKFVSLGIKQGYQVMGLQDLTRLSRSPPLCTFCYFFQQDTTPIIKFSIYLKF